MAVEDELQELANQAIALLAEVGHAADEPTKQRFALQRRVVLNKASQHLARSLQALKLKAAMICDDDLEGELSPGAAFLIRSLLRDLRNWEPRV